MRTTQEIENFGRNVQYTPEVYYEPATEEELIGILNEHAGQKIRVVGRLHSWSRAIEGNEVVVCLKRISTVELVDESGPGSHAWVGAGIQVKRLVRELLRHDRTLPSLGLITEQSIVGALSTGTHGSGRQCLSHFAEAFRIARYDSVTGKAKIELIDSGDAFRAAQCGLGNVGVIVAVKIRCRNRYRVEEFWRSYATLQQVLKLEDEYPLQQFFLLPWQWQYLAQHRRETDAESRGPEWLYRVYFFLAIDILLHAVLATLAKVSILGRLTPSIFRGLLSKSVIQNWRVIGESSRMLVMEQELFRHVETELFVQRDQLAGALEFVKAALEWSHGELPESASFASQVKELGLTVELEAARGVHCHHFPICVRRIIPDNSLVSMTSGGQQDWYSISLISYASVGRRSGFYAVTELISKAAARLFQARPHWGKHVPLSVEELKALYPEFPKYRQACMMLDPEGRFRNDWFHQLMDHKS